MMKKLKISVIIRTYNEVKHIGEVLKSLTEQTYLNHEIIIVDSGSVDGTLDIIERYPVKLVSINKEDFNYSYASNVGVQNSSGDIVCFLSGHSVPVYKNYLEKINEIFQETEIGACYGEVIALPDGSITEKIFNRIGYLKSKLSLNNKRFFLENKIHPGIFSCSNACARKKLLLKYPFKVELGHGGEDVEVAYRIIQDGYFVAKSVELLVMHSHGSSLKKFIKEYKAWGKMYEDVLNFIKKNNDKYQ
ncbi:glycosyltransferase [Lactococcus lactis subsp. lactis]|nr:glycosyltransferase [Lactococcus lactis subsp. lactis]